MIIPDSFEVNDCFFTGSGINMKVKANSKKIGAIKQTHLFTGKQFELINDKKELIAICRKYRTPYGNVIEIFDELNNKVGSIERLLYFEGSRCEKYIIRNVNLDLVAETALVPKIGNIIEFYDMHKIKIAELSKKDGLVNDKWKVNLFGNFDRRLLIFLPIFIGNELEIGAVDTPNQVY